MEHFFQNIQGWSSYRDLYRKMVANANDGSHFVEIGAWKGRAAAFMCVEIINSGKFIEFDVVDTWAGTAGEHEKDPDIINGTLYQTFMKNMSPVIGKFNPIQMHSIDAAKLFDDDSLDFVMIDAAHDYQSVKEDVIAWLPKVKAGGLLAGHDECISGVRRALQDLNIKYSLWNDGVTWLHYR